MTHLLLAVIYISFISLGLPDGLLGAGWPSMQPEMSVPVSYAGTVSMVIYGGTILSALFSERLVAKLGTCLVTAISVGMTALALFGFSQSREFWQLCVWGIPYGLGAGSVDAALNNFVALHYKSRHMSWLHCFWGVGCCTGPYVMSYFLTGGQHWSYGYLTVSAVQVVLTAVLFASLPLWRRMSGAQVGEAPKKSLGLKKTLSIRGVKEVMLTFLCYCAIEQTAGLWAVSYIVFEKGMSADEASAFGAVFFVGITMGRFLGGFVTEKLSDKQMVRLGSAVLGCGAIVMLLPLGTVSAVAGLALVGLGCAPIYPCIIHSTPSRFGADNSQAVIGVQMASAYVGSTMMPPVFGAISEITGIAALPWALLVLLAVMTLLSERVNSITKDTKDNGVIS